MWRHSDTRTQRCLCIRLSALCAKDVAKIHLRWRIPGIETRRCAILTCSFVQPSELRKENPERGAIFGTICLKSLTRYEFVRGPREIILCIDVECSCNRRKNSCSFYSHSS